MYALQWLVCRQCTCVHVVPLAEYAIKPETAVQGCTFSPHDLIQTTESTGVDCGLRLWVGLICVQQQACIYACNVLYIHVIAACCKKYTDLYTYLQT